MGAVKRIPRVYTDEQAARLAKVSVTQVRYWDRTGFFQPSIAFEDRKVAFSRIYSFEDVVALRVLGLLRNSFDVPLQHLRRVRDKFRLPQSVWADEEIFVHAKRVYFRNERGSFTNADTDEDTLPEIPLPQVICEIENEAAQMGIRNPDGIASRTRRANVARRAEVFEGTRIPIDMVKEYMEAGLGVADILSDYPALTEEDISAAVKWLGIAAA